MIIILPRNLKRIKIDYFNLLIIFYITIIQKNE